MTVGTESCGCARVSPLSSHAVSPSSIGASGRDFDRLGRILAHAADSRAAWTCCSAIVLAIAGVFGTWRNVGAVSRSTASRAAQRLVGDRLRKPSKRAAPPLTTSTGRGWLLKPSFTTAFVGAKQTSGVVVRQLCGAVYPVLTQTDA